jgi:hypothetical protein
MRTLQLPVYSLPLLFALVCWMEDFCRSGSGFRNRHPVARCARDLSRLHAFLGRQRPDAHPNYLGHSYSQLLTECADDFAVVY